MRKKPKHSPHSFRHHHATGTISTSNPSQSAQQDEPENVDVEIDGSQGEGGGQVVRASIALSCILRRSLRVTKIRQGRPRPGLGAQHLAGARLTTQLLPDAEVHGLNIGSTRLVVVPKGRGQRRNEGGKGTFECHVGTAGATSLVLQACIPVLLKERCSSGMLVRIFGGTSVPFAPPSEYVRAVFVPNLKQFGVTLDYSVDKHGFYPKGGGIVDVKVSLCSSSAEETDKDKQQSWDDDYYDECNRNAVEGIEDRNRNGLNQIRAVNATNRGGLKSLHAKVLVYGGTSRERCEYIADVMRKACAKTLRHQLSDVQYAMLTTDIEIVHDDKKNKNHRGKTQTVSVHGCVTVHAATGSGFVLGASSVWSGKDGQDDNDSNFSSAEDMAQKVAQELCDAVASGAVLDSYMADQVLLFMAMAQGTSCILVPEPTQHLRTMVDILRQFGVNVSLIQVKETMNIKNNNVIVKCEGLGVTVGS